MLFLKIMTILLWEAGTEGHTLSRQLCASLAWPARSHGGVCERTHTSCPGYLDSEAVQPQGTQVTHFGGVVVMQESWVLPQNKSAHLPVFSLVPLWEEKGSSLTGDSSTSPYPSNKTPTSQPIGWDDLPARVSKKLKDYSDIIPVWWHCSKRTTFSVQRDKS